MFDFLADRLTDTATLVHLAMLAYVVGFLFRNQIVLRLLVLAGTVLYILYYYFHPDEPLWDAIVASLAIGTATVIGLVALLMSRLPIGMEAHERQIFNQFGGLEPGEFRQLLKVGEIVQNAEPTILTREGAPPEHLYFVLEGEIEGRKGDTRFTMSTGEFVGEVSFMLEGDASASVEMPHGGTFMRWPRTPLRRMLARRPKLQQAFEAMIGRDMARKVAQSARV